MQSPWPRALLRPLGAALGAVALLLAVAAPLLATPEETAARLAAAARPASDPAALVQRLQGTTTGGPIAPVRLSPADTGRVDRFIVLDQMQVPNVWFEVNAELRLVSPHAYWYVAQGRPRDDAGLARAADGFESGLYPILQQAAGAAALEPITVLHADLPGVAGYFSSTDQYPRWVFPQSNERPMVYLNVNSVRPGTQAYLHTLSHELTHLFHFEANAAEETWLKEGLGELAQVLSDPEYQYGVGGFLNRPSTPLTAWAEPPDVAVHYQAAFLFVQYLLERFGGPQSLPLLMGAGGRGPSSVDTYLAALGRSERFDDVFRDWVIANLLQDPSVAGGQYGYQRPPQGRPRVTQVTGARREDGRLREYGTDYYGLRGPGSVRVRFEGASTVALVGADPPGGGSFWWSNRGDMLDTRLTRELDLRGRDRATLTFDLRYDTEDAYDYGYALVSTDGGARWQPLTGRYTTSANPAGRNLVGTGYNGKSGDGSGAGWVREEIDLTPYAGQRVLARFEYVTDDAYNADGVAVAHVAVPEIGWQDDGSGWTAEGFAWVENALPQRWAVQLVEYRGDAASVRQMPVDAAGRGEAVLELRGDTDAAVVVVSAMAPLTLQQARYSIDFAPAGQ